MIESKDESEYSIVEDNTVDFKKIKATIEARKKGILCAISGFDENNLVKIDNDEWGIKKAELYMIKNPQGAQFIYIYGDERLIFTGVEEVKVLPSLWE